MKRLLLILLTLFALHAQAVERVIHYHNDALGSPIFATNQRGELVWRRSYTPYGQELNRDAPNESGYTGKIEEPALGISDFGARWYDPRIGRFLAIDPVGFSPENPQSFNRYAYANNNPYRYVDPDGNSPLSAFVTVVAQQTGIGYGLGVAADAISQYAAFGEVDIGIALTSNAAIAGGAAGLLVGALKGVRAAEATGLSAKGRTEIVQRAMSRAELEAIQNTGLLSRGGRAGDHFVSDAVNSATGRARQRLGLPGPPQVRATLEVPSNVFSSPSKVAPKYNMPGGGMERTAPGNVDIPARVLDVLEY